MVHTIASNACPLWAGHAQEAHRGAPCGHGGERHGGALVSSPLPSAASWSTVSGSSSGPLNRRWSLRPAPPGPAPARACCPPWPGRMPQSAPPWARSRVRACTPASVRPRGPPAGGSRCWAAPRPRTWGPPRASSPSRPAASPSAGRLRGEESGPGAPCQGGVVLGDGSHHAHVGLACRLSLPAEWARDAPRRHAGHGPAAGVYGTRPAPWVERRVAWGGQGPPGWGTGDEALRRPPRVRPAGRALCVGGPVQPHAPRPGGARACGARAGPSSPGPGARGDARAPRPQGARGAPLDGARRCHRARGPRDGHTPGADAPRAHTHQAPRSRSPSSLRPPGVSEGGGGCAVAGGPGAGQHGGRRPCRERHTGQERRGQGGGPGTPRAGGAPPPGR